MTYLTAEGKCTIYSEEESFAQAFVRNVKEDLKDIAHGFFKIGFRLTEANKCRYYEELGYDNIIDLAEDIFGFKKSTAYGLMQVYGYCRDRSKNASFFDMDKAYVDFNFSQLQEISRLKWGGGEHLIKPTDTVARIKQFVSAWNKDGETSNASGCESITDYLKKTGRITETEPEIFQISGKSAKEQAKTAPAPLLEMAAQTDESKPIKPILHPEIEVIKVGLTGVDIYVEDAKFQIYDTYKNYGPLEGNFERYIKSVYNYDNKSKFTHGFYSKEDNMNRTYDDAGVQFISFDPHQTVRLTWEEVAQHISELISKNEFLTASEQEEYSKWKAKDKSAEISDKEYDRLMKDLDGLIAGKPQLSDDELSVYCLKLGTGYQYGKFRLYDKVKDGDFTTSEFIDFVKKEYGGIYMGGADNFHKSIEATNRGLEITRLTGGKLILSWSTVAGRIKRLIESGEYLSAEEQEEYARKSLTPALKNSYEKGDGLEWVDPAPVVGKTAMQSSAELTPRRRTRRQYLSELPDEEFVTHLLLQIAKVYPLKGDSAALISSMRKRLIDWLNQPQEVTE